MMFLLLLFLLGAPARHAEPPQRVDRIELNTVTHDHGGDEFKTPMRQIVVWHWHADVGAYHVQDWFLLEGHEEPFRTPSGMWRWWYRGADDRKLHWIESESLVVTTMEYDPEMYDKKIWPEKYRRRLIGQMGVETTSPCPVPGEVVEAPQ